MHLILITASLFRLTHRTFPSHSETGRNFCLHVAQQHTFGTVCPLALFHVVRDDFAGTVVPDIVLRQTGLSKGICKLYGRKIAMEHALRI